MGQSVTDGTGGGKASTNATDTGAESVTQARENPRDKRTNMHLSSPTGIKHNELERLFGKVHMINYETVPKQEPEAHLATVKEAAKALGVTERTIYNLIERGDLPSIKVGRVHRVNLEAFVARGGTQW